MLTFNDLNDTRVLNPLASLSETSADADLLQRARIRRTITKMKNVPEVCWSIEAQQRFAAMKGTELNASLGFGSRP